MREMPLVSGKVVIAVGDLPLIVTGSGVPPVGGQR
jgi:hypothetical protein